MNLNKGKVIGIIPARGGDQDVPRKNIRSMNGKSLLFYSIRHAQNCGFIDRLIVSTEDPEIAKEAKKLDCEVHDRPKEFSQKTSTMNEVILDLLTTLDKENYPVESFILLQPTSPFRTKEHIEKAWETFSSNKDADGLYSIYPKDRGLLKMLKKSEDDFLVPIVNSHYPSANRQDLPDIFMPNGVVMIQKRDTFMKNHELFNGKIVPYLMSEQDSMDIDTVEDFELAEKLLQERESHASIL